MTVGILERNKEITINITGNVGSQLDILVENMGRINYGKDINDFKVTVRFCFKITLVYRVAWSDLFIYFNLALQSAAQGLVTNLTLGNHILSGWTMFSLSIDEAVSQGLLVEAKATEAPQPAATFLPTFYQGSFVIPDGIPDLPQDTYVKLPKWRKARHP